MVRQMMTREERLKANWEGMVKWWGLPDSDGNHRPPPAPPNFSKEQQFLFPCEGYPADSADSDDSDDFYDPDDPDDPAERIFFMIDWFYPDDDEEEEAKKSRENHVDGFLDELKGFLESIDIADELYTIDALEPLLHNVMRNMRAGIRAKAAELVSAMVNNNPFGQELVMETRGLPSLFYNFTSDPDVTARTKALEAISSLIRNNKPGVTEFLLNDGYAKLRDALTSGSVMLQREALNLIQYLLHENSSDCNKVTVLGLTGTMMHLASSDDAEVREAALRCLIVVLTRDEEGGNSGLLVKNEIEGISSMAREDLGATREERGLVDLLWNAYYNKTSSLREKGLLVLDGEDPPGPDVASKLFDPPTSVIDIESAKMYLSWKRHCPGPLPIWLDPPSSTPPSSTVESSWKAV